MMTKERKKEIVKIIFTTMVEKRSIEIGDRVYIWNMFNVEMNGKAKTLSGKEYNNRKEFIVAEKNVDCKMPVPELKLTFLFDLILYDPETKEKFRSSRMNVRLVDDNKILPNDVISLTKSEEAEILLFDDDQVNPILN